MGNALHRDLELRLETVTEHIAALRQKMNRATAREKVEEFGEIAELERRYRVLADRLQALNRQGPGFRQDMKAELEKVADDLSGSVEDLMEWLDSDRKGSPPPPRGGMR
jgi:predicted phage tail protein